MSTGVAPVSASLIDEQLEGIAFDSVFEPFCGEAKLAFYFKRHGKRAIACDALESRYLLALALVENDHVLASPAHVQEWLTLIKDPIVAKRFSPWANRFFTPEETIWLGIWQAHLSREGLDSLLRALGATAVWLTMRYWLSFNRQELVNKPMSPPVAFQHYLQTVNTWVCNRGPRSQAIWGDATVLAPGVEADVLVYRPGAGQGVPTFPEPAALFECWVRGQTELAPAPGVRLTETIEDFLGRVAHIPTWVLTFDDRLGLDEPALTALIERFRPVVRRAAIPIHTGGRGIPPSERLVIARARH
ncbi:MAG TPA: DNA adenine methylase [Oscillatoriaceae cyanobacterium]